MTTPRASSAQIRLILVAITLIFFSTGCATQPPPAPVRRALDITVRSATDAAVAAAPASDGISRAMAVHNPAGQLSNLSFIAGDKAFIKIFSGLSVADVTRFWNDICVLYNTTDVREINLFINSPGGGAFDGLALADEIERARKKGFKIIAHASGIIASAAVPVFAVCDLRLAAPGTIFMVHEAALWKWPGRETASDIRAQGELMILLRDRYMAKLTEHSRLDLRQWSDLEGKTTWFSAVQALDWGLVDKIE